MQAPTEVTFHWSDGHLDVTKKLSFTPDYELTVECAVTLDGKPVSVAVAWRGGFGDKEVYNAAQLVTVFYKQNDKLNLLQYKKLGVSGNQSAAGQCKAARWNIWASRTSFSPRHFFRTARTFRCGTGCRTHDVHGRRQNSGRARSGNGGGNHGTGAS